MPQTHDSIELQPFPSQISAAFFRFKAVLTHCFLFCREWHQQNDLRGCHNLVFSSYPRPKQNRHTAGVFCGVVWVTVFLARRWQPEGARQQARCAAQHSRSCSDAPHFGNNTLHSGFDTPYFGNDTLSYLPPRLIRSAKYGAQKKQSTCSTTKPSPQSFAPKCWTASNRPD